MSEILDYERTVNRMKMTHSVRLSVDWRVSFP